MQGELEAAIADHRQGRIEEAARAYRAILDRAPEDPDALHFFGLLHFQLGHAPEAVGLIRRSLEVRPGQPAAWNNLGNILKRMGQGDEALEAYQAALGLGADQPDPWTNAGTLLRDRGRLDEAEAAFRRALTLDPSHPEALHNLGMCLAMLGRLTEAAAAFERVLDGGRARWVNAVWYARVLTALGRRAQAEALLRSRVEAEPDDAIARHQLDALTGEPVARAPDAYVARHFDEFASSFDAMLAKLDYAAPRLIGEAVAGAARRDLDVVDLGCGTGLCGPALRPIAARLTGVDLSQGMLAVASRRKLYDYLVQAELTEFLREAPPAAFDLAVAADTLCYFGALDAFMAALAPTLTPGGRLIATVERLEDGDGQGVRLDVSGRYAHTTDHVRAAAAAAGLGLVEARPVQLRLELGKPVAGTLVTIARA